MTTTVVAYTSFCDGHVTRFSSLRTSLRNSRQRSNRPPAASLTVSNRPAVSSATFVLSSTVSIIRTVHLPPSRVGLRRTRYGGQVADRSALLVDPPKLAHGIGPERGGQARRESNPQPPVLETGALPIELLAYPMRNAECGVRNEIRNC